MNNPFQKSSEKRKRLKVLLFGPSGTGKTYASLTFPRPAVIDTENGTGLYEKQFQFDVVNGAKDLASVKKAFDFIEQDNGKTYDTLVIDSISVLISGLREHLEANAKGGELGFREHSIVNRRMKAFYTQLTNLPVHVVVTAHEAIDYESSGSGLKKVGVKPFGDEALIYAFDFAVHMQPGYSGRIIKSRAVGLNKNTQLRNVNWSVFEPFAAGYSDISDFTEEINARKESLTRDLIEQGYFSSRAEIGAAAQQVKAQNPSLTFESDAERFRDALILVGKVGS